MAMYEIEKGAEEWVGIRCTERTGADITATAVFEVFDIDGESVQAEVAASVVGNGTDEVEFWGAVDTSAEGFVDGGAYDAKFTMTIDNKPHIRRVHIKLKERRL